MNRVNTVSDKNAFFDRTKDFFEELKGYIYTNNICKQDFVDLSASQNFASSLVRLSNFILQGGASYKYSDFNNNIIESKLRKK